jgi:gluconate 2-dehydrogenase gamma chain
VAGEEKNQMQEDDIRAADALEQNASAPGSADRRGFLKKTVAALGALPFQRGVAATAAGAALSTTAAHAATAEAGPAAGYLCFSQAEAAFVETMVNVMCPTDEFTPNGVDCGLAVYMDRQLAGEFGQGARQYQRGPWQEGAPQLGYQLPLNPQQYFKVGVEVANDACAKRSGKPLDQIGAKEANVFLGELADGKIEDARLAMGAWFNELIYPLFIQACFADPIYGGNYQKVFWKMIGYPGLPATHTNNMVQYRGKPFPGASEPKSIADFS